MARQLKRLTTRTVATLAKIGRHADGGNLYLTISKTDGGMSKRWTFMFAFAGKQREAGFGSASTVTLAEAREKAAEYRSMLAKGISTHFQLNRLPGKPRRRAEHSASVLIN
jgi:hypothetical protein